MQDALLQLGLYEKEGEAWWAWEAMGRRNPDLVRDLTPQITPLDQKRQGSGFALRAIVNYPVSSVQLRYLCRGIVSAGHGCLVMEQPILPAAPWKPEPEPENLTAQAPTTSETAPQAIQQPLPLSEPMPVALMAPMPQSKPAVSADSEQGVVPYSVAPGTDPAVRQAPEGRSAAAIENPVRRRGRLGSVVVGSTLDVTPAVLQRENWNLCALTFDDGPHRVITPQILDLLNREEIPVTYFPIARAAAGQPDIIRDFLASGHEIGNHSLTHPDLRSMTVAEQTFEIAEANRILRKIGADPVLFRPPYGRYTTDVLQYTRSQGMHPVLWTVDTRDWEIRDPDKIVQHVKTTAGTGSVILLHSTYQSTLDALPGVIRELRAKGCQFVTLSEWIAQMEALATAEVVNVNTTLNVN